MVAPRGAQQYKQMAVVTASRGKVLVMLYEAAIQNVKKAILALDQKDLALKGKHIIKAHEILNEFINTLNFDLGGEIARDLERLYQFMIEQLIQANLKNEKEPLMGIQKNLETLLSAWRIATEEVQKIDFEKEAK